MHWFVYAAFLLPQHGRAGGVLPALQARLRLTRSSATGTPSSGSARSSALLSTVGIVFLIVYRQKHHPRSEGRNSRFFGSNFWQAYFVEALALLEGAAILFVRAAEWKLDEEAGRLHYPISSLLGDALYPSSATSLENLIYLHRDVQDRAGDDLADGDRPQHHHGHRLAPLHRLVQHLLQARVRRQHRAGRDEAADLRRARRSPSTTSTTSTRSRSSASARSRTSPGRASSTSPPAPSAVAASRSARPGTPRSRSRPSC